MMTDPSTPLFPTNARNSRLWFRIMLLAMVIITIIFYLPQLGLYFDLNDDIVILYRAMLNTWRVELSPLHVLDIFRLDYFPLLGGKPEKYRPIHNLIVLVLFPILTNHPLGYHIVALFIHLFTCLLLWRFTRHLGVSPPVSALSVLLFLIYFPGAEVATRFNMFPESLSTTFLLLGSILFIRAIGSDSIWNYLFSFIVFSCAALTKISSMAILAFLLMLVVYAERHSRNIRNYKRLWNWLAFTAISLMFLTVFYINAKVQPDQVILVNGVLSEPLENLIINFLATPFANLIPLTYPSKMDVLPNSTSYWLYLTCGISLAALALWRIGKGDWLEKGLWIFSYASIVHTIFLPSNARYEYLWGIPGMILVARYSLMFWNSYSSRFARASLTAALCGLVLTPQILTRMEIDKKSTEGAQLILKVQEWVFDAMTPNIRHPYERALLTKKFFIPTEQFLSYLYLYPPYREDVERVYGVKLPDPLELGLSKDPPPQPMFEPTSWMKPAK